MKFIPRYYQNLDQYLKSNKVLVLYGPRQVGKTTLVQNFLQKTKLKYRFDTGESLKIQTALSSQDLKTLKEYSAEYQLIVIDEAQYIPNIG